MPARRSTLFATSPTARPTPCGAGLSVTTTDPLRAVTRKGNEWERWQPHSQDPQPRLISIMFNFALSMARRIDGPTSRPRARPRPANPSLFPTMHVITKFTRRPESVIRWTMLTSRTSSSVSGNRMSTISGSRIGRLVLIASPRLVISPARTMRPSFVFGTQAERSLSGRAARASRRRPPLRCGIRAPPVSSSRCRRADPTRPRCVFRGRAPSPATRLGYEEPPPRNRGGLGGRQRAGLPAMASARRGRGSLPSGHGRTPGGPRDNRQVGRGQVPCPRGPTMLLELGRLGGREHAVSRRLRDDQLHDHLPQRFADHRPRLPAPEELRSHPVIGPALPPSAEGHPIVRTLGHFATPSRRTPAARNCWSRCAFDLNMPPFD